MDLLTACEGLESNLECEIGLPSLRLDPVCEKVTDHHFRLLFLKSLLDKYLNLFLDSILGLQVGEQISPFVYSKERRV